MYSSRQHSFLREQFWISFGKYMSPVLSASGGRISWMNYDTGIKSVFFRMHVAGKDAYIGIEIENKDPAFRISCFRRFHSLRDNMLFFLGEEWRWEEEAVNANGKQVSRICKTLEPVNINNQNDWPAIISFLKPRIIALDAFWSENHVFFETFRQ